LYELTNSKFERFMWKCIILCLISFVIVIFTEQYSYGLLFGNNIELSNKSSVPHDADIQVVGNNVYVVWSDNSTGNGDIYFKRSMDNGTKFAIASNIAKNNGSSISPQIAAVGNNVYVVWSDNSTGNGDIYFKRSMDNGDNFDRRKFVSKNNGSSISPQIAAVGNNVYVVWSDNSTGNGEIRFRGSMDNGTNFKTKNLSNNPGTSSEPRIVTYQNNVFVVWSDNSTGNGDIYMKISTDNANSFSTTKKLSRNNGSSISPRIAAVGNNVYVVWSDNSTGNGDIYFKRSMDNGDNFRRIENLSKDQTRSSAPDINVLGKSNVYIFWVDTNLNKKTILFRASGDNGTRFDKVVSLTKDVLFSSSYDVVVNKNDLFLVWMGNRSIVEDRKVYFKRISEDFFDRNP
jgi:hypothetical protein